MKNFKIKIITISVFILLLFVFVSLYSLKDLYKDEVNNFANNLNVACYNLAEDLRTEIDNHNKKNFDELYEQNPQLKEFKKFSKLPIESQTRIFTSTVLNEKITKYLREQNISKIDFEFGIQKKNGSYDIYSDKFIIYDEQALSNKQDYPIRIVPLNVSEEIVSHSSYNELLVIIFKLNSNYFLKKIWNYVFLNILLLIIVVISLYLIIHFMINNYKINIIKNDFINNMTHELKTPLTTLKIAFYNFVNSEEIKVKHYKTIILGEINKMTNLVETILKIGNTEKLSNDFNPKPSNINQLLEKLINDFELQITEKNGSLIFNRQAENVLAVIDVKYFLMMMNNLIDNAIKYSKDVVHITLELIVKDHKLIIKVSDKGIGMNKDTINNIFIKYYRAHTGNIHDVKGFGLGMTFVKQIVDLHNGKIKVESQLNKGSTITVELPMVSENL